ncbi:hypothetical protein [Hydrogenophaga sp. 5NK40-0174]|uniref:hypothetical protein n=1 Tax=Hydrogenophaga sp. 5NK40-0174 TaxID=3127649 RepID=UPI003102BFA1
MTQVTEDGTLWHRRGAQTLLVMLPGAYMKAQDMVEAGCFSAMDAKDVDLDVCVPALDLSTLSAGLAMPMMEQTLLAPARSTYSSVWLGGISLGGELAMWQAATQPQTVDGLCLIAPYPGSRITLNRIEASGGVDAWEPTPAQGQDPEFQVWQWLKAPPARLPVFVGYGTDDRFALGMGKVASRLSHGHCSLVPGGHDWGAWLALWQTFLDSRLWVGSDARA